MPLVRSIVREAANDDYRFKSIVLGIVSSDAFRKRESAGLTQAPEAGGAKQASLP